MNELFTKEEAESAEIQVIHPELSSFVISWADFTVQKKRFQISIGSDPLIRVSDLAAKIFGTFLSHTPISALGINRLVSFQVASIEQRDAIGHELAPPDAWGDWASSISARSPDNASPRGGLVSLTMQAGRDDGFGGHTQARVRPDASLNVGTGIEIHVNDHYELGDGSEEETASSSLSDLPVLLG
ncbi:MAG: hypothetical protein PF501_06835 [Salinisphaera sp.]|nr:hypothetical protein [Salinisphaera sp.]